MKGLSLLLVQITDTGRFHMETDWGITKDSKTINIASVEELLSLPSPAYIKLPLSYRSECTLLIACLEAVAINDHPGHT